MSRKRSLWYDLKNLESAYKRFTNNRQGIQGKDMLYSWFSTSFDVPSQWTGERTLLNFGAIDYEATIFVNGQNASFHRGGYFAFTVDVTDHLATNGTNELYAPSL